MQTKGQARARAWTLDEGELCKSLCESGFSIAEIAVILGRTPRSIQDKKLRDGLTNLKSINHIPREIKNDPIKMRVWLWEKKIKPVLVEKENGCLEWRKAVDRDGYGEVSAYGKLYRTHRVALEVNIGKILNSEIKALHSCDNPKCCNPDHLRPGTTVDNSIDMVRRGRSCKGVKSHSSKMTDDLVRLARSMYIPGETIYKEMSKIFRVSATNMSNIINRRTWTHI